MKSLLAKLHTHKTTKGTPMSHVKRELPNLQLIPSKIEWLEYSDVRLKQQVITIEEENVLLDLLALDKTLQFVDLRGRKTAAVGGSVDPGSFDSDGALEKGWLREITDFIYGHVRTDMSGHPLNHVLINFYPPGGGIMPHEDGPRYFPVVNILSVGSGCVMNFESKKDGRRIKVFVPPRSLLQFKAEVFTDFRHGIEFSTVDAMDDKVLWSDGLKECLRSDRYSLTFRYVPAHCSSLEQSLH
jgi:hypothetical protein